MQPNVTLTPANARAARVKAPGDLEWWSAFWRWCDSKMSPGPMSDSQMEANVRIMEKVYEEPIDRNVRINHNRTSRAS